MRRWKLALFLALLVVVFLLPNPELFVARAMQRLGLVGLLLLVVRGLMDQYDDFNKPPQKKRRRAHR